MIPSGPDSYASVQMWDTLKALQGVGVNAVTLTTTYSMDSVTSSSITAGQYTATDRSLGTTIALAHLLGMYTSITIYVNLSDGTWRARLKPADRDRWFAQYGAILNHLADVSEQSKVDRLCIGVELISLTTATSNPDNTSRWLALIRGVRARYHGRILYAANWGGSFGFGDEFSHIEFWNALDEVGIDAYYPLATHYAPTLAELEASWGRIHDTVLVPFAHQVRRPIVFTEVGYRSISATPLAPADNTIVSAYDGCAQAQAYFALLDSWKNSGLLVGIYWWYWTTTLNSGGAGDTTYSPMGKPAEAVIAAFWHGTSSNTPQNLGKMLSTCQQGG